MKGVAELGYLKRLREKRRKRTNSSVNVVNFFYGPVCNDPSGNGVKRERTGCFFNEGAIFKSYRLSCANESSEGLIDA